MATNEIFREAENLTLPVVSGTVAGDPVMVGSLVGVALLDRDADGNSTVRTKGAFRLQVTGEVTAVGQPLYFVAASPTVLDVSSNTGANPLFGYALEVKTATTAAITVRLAQV